MSSIKVNCGNIEISNDNKICIIAGPCQLESEQHAMDMAGKIKEITKKFGLGFIYKTSFDKANRTSLKSKRGLGLFFGMELTKNGKPAQKEAEEILYHSLSNGLSYKVGGGCILTLCPPMTITEEQLNEAFDVIEAGIKEVS